MSQLTGLNAGKRRVPKENMGAGLGVQLIPRALLEHAWGPGIHPHYHKTKTKFRLLNWVWWHVPVIPELCEAEAGGSEV